MPVIKGGAREPTQGQLEARLEYFVPKLTSSVAHLEARAAELAVSTERPLPKKRWFAALLRARDALAYHANGDLRQMRIPARQLPYARRRLTNAGYYKAGKSYSGESEDDANEALRRLEGLGEGERFALHLDAIDQRKQRAAEAIRRSQDEVAPVTSWKLDLPLQGAAVAW